jgi:hypothetical protein
MYLSVDLSSNLFTCRSLMHKSKDLPVCLKGVSRPNASNSPPSLSSTLIEQPIEESIDNAERDVPHCLFRILVCVLAVSVNWLD